MQMMINQKWKHLENNSNENRGRNASQPRAAMKIRLFHTLGSLISRVCVFACTFCFILICASHHSACWLMKISSIETTETSEGTRFFLIPLVQCQFFFFFSFLGLCCCCCCEGFAVRSIFRRILSSSDSLASFSQFWITWIVCDATNDSYLFVELKENSKTIFWFFVFKFFVAFFFFCFYYCYYYYYFITSFG